MQETCGICGREFPYSATVHVLVHTKADEGVVDYDVCRSCYEEHLEPLFAAGEAAAAAREGVGDANGELTGAGGSGTEDGRGEGGDEAGDARAGRDGTGDDGG